MNFASDNWSGAHPDIVTALARANEGLAPPYGADALTRRVEARFCEIFERDVSVFFVATGGAANALALSVMAPPYGMILCHEQAHIQMDECGAPEFFTGGAKLLPLKGFAGKIVPGVLSEALASFPERPPHGCPARVLSITQASECGAVYSLDETRAVCASAHAAGLKVHMDGARFANALAALGCSPAQASWMAGVDVLSFGGTKNGCIGAEAVVFFEPNEAGDFAFRRKRGGQLLSKMRYVSAQFDAYLDNGLWLRLAAHANAMAKRLAQGISQSDGCRLWYPADANEVFAEFPDDALARLADAGAHFYSWVTPGDPARGRMKRLVCSWATKASEVELFLATLQRA